MNKIILFVMAITVVVACKKEPGQGGRATIKGKVITIDYDATYTIAKDTFPAQGENVYLLYGDDNSVGDNTKTSFDGTFEFPYLRTGKYRIFVVSKDTAAKISNKTIEVLKEVNITEKKQVKTLDDFTIFD
jgi:hypothetical protein